MLRKFFYYWFPVVAWTAAITMFSTDDFSSQHTGSVIEQIVAFVLGHPLPPPRFDTLHLITRKLGHLTEYAILGALTFRATRGEGRGWAARWAITAIAIAAAVATSDEIHQHFVPSRTASPIDVGIDVVGATMGIAAWRVRR